MFDSPYFTSATIIIAVPTGIKLNASNYHNGNEAQYLEPPPPQCY